MISSFALKFGPPEFFAVYLLTFCSFVGLGREAKHKTIISMTLGLLLAWALGAVGEQFDDPAPDRVAEQRRNHRPEPVWRHVVQHIEGGDAHHRVGIGQARARHIESFRRDVAGEFGDRRPPMGFDHPNHHVLATAPAATSRRWRRSISISEMQGQEYASFGRGHGHDLAPFDRYFDEGVRGLRWPVVEGKETPWRFNAEYDPYVRKGARFDFYGPAMKDLPAGDLRGVTDPKPVSIAGKAKIFFRPYSAPPESPDAQYDLWLSTGRVLEHWHSGTMTRRVPELYQAMPSALLYMNARDAEKRGLKRNDVAWLESRRGRIKAVVETGGRYRMPPGMVYVPWFDEGIFINKLTLDATCPISKQTDFKKCAVKVTKVDPLAERKS